MDVADPFDDAKRLQFQSGALCSLSVMKRAVNGAASQGGGAT